MKPLKRRRTGKVLSYQEKVDKYIKESNKTFGIPDYVSYHPASVVKASIIWP